MLEIRKDKEKILLNVFSNISEYYNFCKKTPRRPSADNSSEDTGGDRKKWTGTETLEEAYELLVNGDEKLFQEISKKKNKIDITKVLGNKIGKNRPFNDIVGFQADVSSYLKGIPTNMINQKPLKVSQKILNIFIDGAVSAGVSPTKIREAGVIYASVIDILEKRGYRCNLYIIESSEYEQWNYYSITRVKTDREPFNLKKLAFPIAHPAYFRRIGFKWIESCNIPVEPTSWGYGKPINDKKKMKDTLEKYLKMNVILWRKNESYDVTIENVLKNLKDSGINLEGE